MAQEQKSDFNGFDRRLTLLFVLPPVIWLTHLTVAYSLVPTACVVSNEAALHVVTALALVANLVLTVRSWKHATVAGRGSMDHGEPHDTRIRFMAFGALIYGAFFTMLVAASEVPILMLRSCD